jgi:peroxiredoxin
LLDFQRNIEEFEKNNIKVVAASADTLEDAIKTVEKYKLTFKVGYGLNPEDISAITGAFYNKEKEYIHATGFIINQDGKIENAVYSSRSLGRLVAKDCLAFIKE